MGCISNNHASAGCSLVPASEAVCLLDFLFFRSLALFIMFCRFAQIQTIPLPIALDDP